MLKVLFVTRKWPPAIGGMELYSSELATALKAYQSIDLTVLSLKGGANGEAPRLPGIFAFVFRVMWYLVRNGRRYDIVHLGDFVLFPLALFDRFLCPSRVRLMTVYGLDLTFGRATGVFPRIYRSFLAFCANQKSAVDNYIAISRFTGELARSVGLGPVSVVPLGIRMENFSDVGVRSDGAARQKKPFVLFLGRVVPRKGASWFAREVLPQFDGELSFVVAGRVYSDAERECLDAVPGVHVLGQISHEDAIWYRKNAVAVVMPNIPVDNSADVEGFGLTALEAPATGSVLIASRLEGIEDAVIDGVTGLLARPADADDWKEKLEDVLRWSSVQRAEFLGNARMALKDDYSWDRVAQRTVNVYRETWSGKQTRRHE